VSPVRIAIAGDHHGVALKAQFIAHLTAQGHEVHDCGAPEGAAQVDYPPLCADVGYRVADGRADRGIVLGGSGQGETIACNKIRGIRAGLCHTLFATQISRAHNDANVLIIGTKLVGPDLALEILDRWLTTPFKAGPHAHRLTQITALENGGPLG
jgi:ribose 5-phosphate isomerase B